MRPSSDARVVTIHERPVLRFLYTDPHISHFTVFLRDCVELFHITFAHFFHCLEVVVVVVVHGQNRHQQTTKTRITDE